jgi:ubiquinone/menaquinone biosynthesis C-methylase UbiE
MLRTAPGGEKLKPKQCIEINSSVFQELDPGASQKIANHLLVLCPPVDPGSVIHDNVSGPGVVTGEVMKADNDPSGISIYATSLSQEMVEACQKNAVESGWSDAVIVSLMAMKDLMFTDNSFTHSFTNFAIFSIPDNEAAQAASHIYRTLKPGRTAAIATWAEALHKEVLQSIHQATRGTTSSLPTFKNAQWQEPAHLQHVLQRAGFSADKI